MLEIMATTGLL